MKGTATAKARETLELQRRVCERAEKAEAELAELLGNYGKIDLLWFDTDGEPAPWDQERTYAIIKKLQPDIVINNRLDLQEPGQPQAEQVGHAGRVRVP